MICRRRVALLGQRLARQSTTRTSLDAGGQVSMGTRIKGRKRFYKTVDIREAPRENVYEPTKYEVLLDGRPIKPRPRVPLRVPTGALAIGIASEWARQVDTLDPSTMPLMTLASTAQDLMPTARPKVIKSLMRFVETDTTCVRDYRKPSFADRQREAWDPLLRWLEEEHNVHFNLMMTLTAEPQPEETFAFFQKRVEELDNWRLQAFNHLTNATKSIVLALGVLDGRITADEAYRASRVEEEFQIDEWGLVEGGHDVDRAYLRVQAHACGTFLSLLDDGAGVVAQPAVSSEDAANEPGAGGVELEDFLRDLEQEEAAAWESDPRNQ